MHIRCPNCERSFQPEGPSDDERYTCSSCNRLIYVDTQGIFPAISAMTYPGANLEAQPLKSFFFMAVAQAIAAPLAPQEEHHTLKTHSLDAPPEPPHDPPPSVTVSPSLDAPHKSVLGTASLPEEPEVPEYAAPASVADELPIQALGTGSFGPPPPLRSVNLGGLVTPPWEQEAPPPLAKIQDEAWSVPNPGGPPPVPKRNEADEFAKALGLPDLGSLGVHHAPAAHGRAPVTDDEPEEAPAKKSLAWLYVLLGAVLLTGGAVFAALRSPPRPLPAKFSEDMPLPPREAASQPASEVAVPAAKPPAARTEALEHYNRGNKLYLQKKLPSAVEEFKKAVDLDATFGLAHRGLGVAYASEGKAELAIKEYKAYLKISPDAKDAKQVETLIKNFEK